MGFTGITMMACAQTAPGREQTLPPELAWRVEVLFRSKASLPPSADVHVGPRAPSEIAGYDRIAVTYTAPGQSSQPVLFLLSHDGRTLIPFNKFDISGEPRSALSEEGRPARGGPETAPVSIVVFDDLQCPFCARLNATLFPAVLDRYKDQVRVVYLDYPIPDHPWSLRAAIDTGCVAKQSGTAYWSAVDTIHAQASQLGGERRILAQANDALDSIVRRAGALQHVDEEALQACIRRQDASSVEVSRQEGRSMGIEVTPTFFINGAKVEGDAQAGFIEHMIDSALIARGKTPPATNTSHTSTSSSR
jgi:protein-disulfide isomerase